MRRGLPLYVYNRWQGEMAFDHNEPQTANPMTDHEADNAEISPRVSRALVWENRSRRPMIRFADRYLTVTR